MKPKPTRIQKILTTNFMMTMLVIVALFMLLFTFTEYRRQKIAIDNEMQRTCKALAEDVDLQIKQMDTVCLNIINSTSIKRNFYNYLYDKDASPFNQSQYLTQLANDMTAIKGVDNSIRQVNIYGRIEKGFGTGNYTGTYNADVTEFPWYQEATAADGYRYIPAAVQNKLLSHESGTREDRYYLSLVRMYFDEFHNPMGYIQVMKYYDVLFQRASFPHDDYDLDIVVISSHGDILFPLEPSAEQKGYIEYIRNPDSATNNHIYFTETEYSDFTIIAAADSQAFFAPIYYQLNLIFILFFIASLICLLVAAAISNRISAPIKDIYHQLDNKAFNQQMEEIALPDSNIIEIDKLKNVLNDSLRSRNETMGSLLLLKEQEVQAQMLALQSQMNPHFLYNSLATIQAMGEEGMTSQIAQMCQDITSILRYISSGKEQTTSLEEELEHCELYLQCLILRYGSSLTYCFDIPDALLDLPVPKLCIQLLLENAVKFSSRISPPWHIHIKGALESDFWYVDVIDNGPGFDQETSDNLRRQMDDILATGLLPSLELDGMGILNIFIRLYLLYGIPFTFDFGNNENGGAFVRVGGSLDGKAEN